MGWFKVSDGRVVYPGRIAPDPYADWVATREGAAAVDEVARDLRFRLLGRTRAARKRIWREIEAAARSEDGRAALQAAADLYLEAISALAYAPGLPRVSVDLRRLVLVPRALAVSRARPAMTARLRQCPAFAERPIAQGEFLFEAALTQVDLAVRAARPSVRRPVRGPDDWVVVEADTRFLWVDRLWSGPGWTGHWFVYEHPRGPLSRAERRAVEGAIVTLQASIASLPRERRHALVKLAAS
jgi:hypothetical protein